MSSVKNDINKARMAAALLFTLPGSPYIYYGEELGMRGKKPDEFIREPFLWDEKNKDQTRTKWFTPRYSNDTTITAAATQLKDEASLLNHYKKFIALRNSSKALALGTLNPITSKQKKFVLLKEVLKTGNCWYCTIFPGPISLSSFQHF